MAIALVFRAYQQQGLNLRLLLNYSNVAAIAAPVNRRGSLSFVARSNHIGKLKILCFSGISFGDSEAVGGWFIQFEKVMTGGRVG